MPDISSLLSQKNIQLEAEAFQKFGAAVRGNETITFPQTQQQTNTPINQSTQGDWQSSTYASRLASGYGGLDPKTKFLFKVKFKFSPLVRELSSSLGVDFDDIQQGLTFTIKQIDLPKIDFKYQDVNLYNFRSKVLTSIEYREMSMIFYDDVANNSLKLITVYQKLLMPIARFLPKTNTKLEDYGFEFSENYINALDSSYRSAFRGDKEGEVEILSQMTIDQFYVGRRKSGSPVESVYVNSFIFTNPRISTMDINQQDYEDSEPNTITAQFNFDGLYTIIENKNKADAITPYLPGADILDGVTQFGGTNSQEGKYGDENVFSQNSSTNFGSGQGVNALVADSAGGGLATKLDSLSSPLQFAKTQALSQVKNKTIPSLAKIKPAILKDTAGILGGKISQTSSEIDPNDIGSI